MSGATIGPSTQIYLGAAHANAGDRQQAQAILKQLETSENYVSPGELAILYGALGEREQAFKSLEKAFAARDLQLQFLGVDPAFDRLRGDPRFADLMRRVGLPARLVSSSFQFSVVRFPYLSLALHVPAQADTPVEDDVNGGWRAALRRVIQEKSLAVGRHRGMLPIGIG